MANLTYLKGVRTRYRNILERELTNSKAIIYSDLVDSERSKSVQDAKKCLKLIKVYSVKLEEQSEKLNASIGDNDAEFVETVLDEDSKLILDAEYCLVEIEQFIESIERDEQNKKEDEEKRNKTSETENLVGIQQQMQNMMFSQMQQQREFFERNKNKDKVVCSVKLPKLDLTSYGGNKLNWSAFWDAFECTVHLNKTLSNIDKFNYLLSKLYGEARKSIEGLALSNENYEVAIGILRERFGNTQDVVNLHYKELINIPPVSQRVESLRTFLDTIEKHFRSLEVLQEDINQHVFVSMITSKLPEHVLRQLELNKGTKQEWTVDYLREEIREYVTACEKAEKIASTNKDGNDYKGIYNRSTTNQPYSSGSTSSAEALMTLSNTSQVRRYSNLCRYCEMHHWSDECPKYQTISERKQQLWNSCHKCLNVSHRSTDCKRNKFCFHCGVSNVHHRSLCPRKFQLKRSNESVHVSEEITKMSNQSGDSDENVLISSGEMILMQTAKTELKNPSSSSSQQTRILLDCGSQRTYITEQLATTLGLERGEETEINLVTFGSHQSKVLKTTSTKLDIKLKNGTVMQIVANIVPSITGTIYRKPLKKAPSDEYNYLVNSLDMADSIPTECESSTIELLLGNDYYLDLILSQKIEIQPGFYFLASKLGWILTGRTGVIEDEHDDTNMLVLTYRTNVTETNVFTGVDEILSTKPIIEDFRNNESIGIKDKTEDTADEKAMKTLKQTPRRENGKYQVAWSWKGDTSDLSENRGLLLDRLKSLTNKLKTQPEFMKRCDTIIQDQLNDGVVEEVDRESCDGIKYYIPYHIVIKPLKATANLRVVYDASDKIRKKYKSLIECLYRCHVLIRDLCDIILRSRLPKIGNDSDIEIIFLQVELQPPERDVTRKRIQIVV